MTGQGTKKEQTDEYTTKRSSSSLHTLGSRPGTWFRPKMTGLATPRDSTQVAVMKASWRTLNWFLLYFKGTTTAMYLKPNRQDREPQYDE